MESISQYLGYNVEKHSNEDMESLLTVEDSEMAKLWNQQLSNW